ncbi:hypothetical protein DCS_00484 [Drechmeria coniospora]|uniref:Uncharacterized protein n=1 Tax=Drechmeria coniospora TaxID=98403 RepID=A0A151GQF4_DRECN|nr:hypothetical protein DCS_00484 [Drechmeria coniospora]KYK59354.1 hypothetical protein DCS_00484 [Drechmeria coniospora]
MDLNLWTLRSIRRVLASCTRNVLVGRPPPRRRVLHEAAAAAAVLREKPASSDKAPEPPKPPQAVLAKLPSGNRPTTMDLPCLEGGVAPEDSVPRPVALRRLAAGANVTVILTLHALDPSILSLHLARAVQRGSEMIVSRAKDQTLGHRSGLEEPRP